MQFRRRAIFLTMLFFSTMTIGTCFVLAQDLKEVPPPEDLKAVPQADGTFFGHAYPQELADLVWKHGFIGTHHFPYRRLLITETGEIDRASMVWKKGDAHNEVKIDSLELVFESLREGSYDRQKYTVSIEYLENKFIVRHSSPAGKLYQNGMRIGYSERRGSKWGGFIYGHGVPGVLFFIPRTESAYMPPMLVCPRYAKKKGIRFVLQGRDPKTKLISVTGKLSGKVSAHFLTGYQAGSAQIDFASMRAAEAIESEKFVVGRDTRIAFEYLGEDVRVSGDLDDSGFTPVGVQTSFKMINSAGREKSVKSSRMVWVSEMPFKIPGKIRVLQEGVKQWVNIKTGACAYILPMGYRQIKYTNPEVDEDAEPLYQ